MSRDLQTLWQRITTRKTTLAEEARVLDTTAKRLRGELRRAGFWAVLPPSVPKGTKMPRQYPGDGWPRFDPDLRRRTWDVPVIPGWRRLR